MGQQITVCIIGRGKSGTRIPAQLLLTGDGYIGKVINASLDKTPFSKIYEAARLTSAYIEYKGNYQWDFSKLHEMPIPQRIKNFIDEYLEDIYQAPNLLKGWKLPETIFIYPFLVRHLPDIHYLFWYRDPYSVIRKFHNTEDLSRYGIEMPLLNGISDHERIVERRACSWLYQWQIVQETPKPKNFLAVSYDDFMTDPESVSQQIEAFIGKPLGRIVVRKPDSKKVTRLSFPFLNNVYPQKNLV